MFNPGDYVTQINSGEECVVISVDFVLMGGQAAQYTCVMMAIRTGARIVVTQDRFLNWTLTKNYNATLPNPPIPPFKAESLEETLKMVTYDDTKIKLWKDTFHGCKHEWVTWTGLRGTQTDCSKCKEIKKE